MTYDDGILWCEHGCGPDPEPIKREERSASFDRLAKAAKRHVAQAKEILDGPQHQRTNLRDGDWCDAGADVQPGHDGGKQTGGHMDSPLPIDEHEKTALMDVAWIKLKNDPDLRFALQRLSYHEIRRILDGLSTAMLIWLDEKASRTAGNN